MKAYLDAGDEALGLGDVRAPVQELLGLRTLVPSPVTSPFLQAGRRVRSSTVLTLEGV